MANQKKKKEENWENGKEKGGEKKKQNAREKKLCCSHCEFWWRIPWTVTMDGPRKQAILVYTPSPFLLLSPPLVTCPVTNPIIMPIQLSKLCAYFNFSSLFTVAFFCPLSFFFFFLCRVLWPGNRWNGDCQGGEGRGKCSDWGGDILCWRLSATA